jgi:ABC-2 type transport system ATP-binding protein
MSQAATTRPPAILTQGLTKFYGETPVVRRLDLSVPAGCVYGFLGRNGAGKSTTIRMLTGMIEPDEGEALLLGEDPRTMTPQTRSRIAYVAEGHPLYQLMTIERLERFTRSFYERWNSELFGQIIEHFGLPGRQRIWRLSNGQRAQVALALAVAPDPELLILDDPTLGLDTVVRRDMLESLVQLIQREGRTILFSSHILGDVERVADRIGILVDGVLRVDCPTDQFKQSVRKLIITFADSPKAYPQRKGVLSDVVIRERRELVVANFSDEHVAAAESLDPKSVEVVELNLEDAFIEYTRGERRPLPDLRGTASGPSPAIATTAPPGAAR